MVDAIGSSSLSAASLKQLQDEMFNKLDANGDGSISKDELSAAVQGSGDTQGPSVDEVFSAFDTDNDSAISKLESDAGLAKIAQQLQESATNQDQSGLTAGGQAGGKGGAPAGGGGAAAASDASSSSDSSTVYDKRDTNKDGVVSPEEELAYEMKHPEEAAKNATASAAPADGQTENQPAASGAAAPAASINVTV